jgi:hypothetical protein
MYVHPALAQLKSTRRLDVVDGLRKSLGYRLVKEAQEACYEITNGSGGQQVAERA